MFETHRVNSKSKISLEAKPRPPPAASPRSSRGDAHAGGEAAGAPAPALVTRRASLSRLTSLGTLAPVSKTKYS